MTTPESARQDLYHGLVEVLGETRAHTLMTYLPAQLPSDIATKADLAELRADVGARFDRLESRFDGLDRRIDRIYLTLAAGLFVIVAAMIGVMAATLA